MTTNTSTTTVSFTRTTATATSATSTFTVTATTTATSRTISSTTRSSTSSSTTTRSSSTRSSTTRSSTTSSSTTRSSTTSSSTTSTTTSCPLLELGPGVDSDDCVGKFPGETCTLQCSSQYQGEAVELTCAGAAQFLEAAARIRCISTITGSEPVWCTEGLPDHIGVDVTGCGALRDDEICNVSCLGAYRGEASPYRCLPGQGYFNGSGPICELVTCDGGIPAYLDSSSCAGKQAGDFCFVACPTGFVSRSLPYKCQGDGLFHLQGFVEGSECERLPCPGEQLPVGLGVDSSDCADLTIGGGCNMTCLAGFQGEPTVVTCDLQGQHHGGAPTCEPLLCTTTLQEGLQGCEGTRHGESCSVRCADGYVGDPAQHVCNWPVLEGISPSCSPVACDKRIPHGRGINASDCDGKATGESCTPTCLDGFTATSAPTTCLCGADGSFQGCSLSCEPITCGDLANMSGFESVTLAHSCDGKAVGESCLAYCATGYDLVGAASVLKCDSSGDFVNATSGLPAIAPMCEGRACSTTSLQLRGLTHDCSGKVTGETCTLIALPGFAFDSGSGFVTMSCGVDGTFEGTMPAIRAAECGALPPFGSNVGHTCSGKEAGSSCWAYCLYNHSGDASLYECRATFGGAELQPASALICDDDAARRLEGRRLTGPCDSSESTVGLLTAGLTHDCLGKADGEQCIVECAEGYSPNASVYMCSGGSFDGPGLPTCVANVCDYSLPYGPGVEHNCSNVRTGENCTATCGQGFAYAAGSVEQSFTCGATGELLGTNPSCTALPCAALQLSQGRRDASCSGKVTGESCLVDCMDGWSLSGDAAVFSCSENGDFVGTEPLCQAMTCTQGIPPDADLNSTGCQGLTTGQTCSVTCRYGNPGVTATYTCSAFGLLEGQRPDCTPPVCPDTVSLSVPGAVHNCQGLALGSRCSVSCGTGLELSSGATEPEWACTWDNAMGTAQLVGTSPQCELAACRDDLSALASVFHTCAGVTSGMTCFAACAPGYDGHTAILFCTGSGSLQGARPQCEPQRCADPVAPLVPGHLDSCTGLYFGSSCHVLCPEGYSGTAEWTCAMDAGSFTVSLQGAPPQCEPLPCLYGIPVGLQFAHNCSNVGTGSQCVVECGENWVGAPEILRCRANGALEGAWPTCLIVTTTTTSTTITSTTLTSTTTSSSTSSSTITSSTTTMTRTTTSATNTTQTPTTTTSSWNITSTTTTTTTTGTLMMIVSELELEASKPALFAADLDAKAAISDGLKEFVGIPGSEAVVVMTAINGRRLTGRRLQSSNVHVGYGMAFPPDVTPGVVIKAVVALSAAAPLSLTEVFMEALASAGVYDYAVRVSSVRVPVLQMGYLDGIVLPAPPPTTTTEAVPPDNVTITTTATTQAPSDRGPVDTSDPGIPVGGIIGVILGGLACIACGCLTWWFLRDREMNTKVESIDTMEAGWKYGPGSDNETTAKSPEPQWW